MKTKLLIITLSISLIIGLLVCKMQNKQICELALINVEALTNDEWGGGHDGPDGIEWYSYIRTTYEFRYCYSLLIPFYVCECEVKTCHGYGDLFCTGSVNCYE